MAFPLLLEHGEKVLNVREGAEITRELLVLVEVVRIHLSKDPKEIPLLSALHKKKEPVSPE
jgi:hypothetical protein